MPDLADVAAGPDLAHAAVAQAALDAVDALAVQVDRLDRAFLLLLGAGQGMQGTLNVVQSGQAAIEQLQLSLAQLTARVAALENPTTPTGGL